MTMTDTALLFTALQEQLCVTLNYDGKPKTVEVHAYGLSNKDQAPVMRVFQVDGESSRPLPSWALLRLDKVTDLALSNRESLAPRDGYKMNDSHMSEIYAQITTL